MPPRKKHEPQPVTRTAEAMIGDRQFVCSDICYAKLGGTLASYTSVQLGVNCGCRECHPEFWCSRPLGDGKVCTRVAVKPEREGDPPLCPWHQAELRGAKRCAV